MLTISNARPLRLHHEIDRRHIAAMTRIDAKRLRELELGKAEPWFDEALNIARTLNVSVHDLLSSRDVTDFDTDPRFHAADVRYWTDGARLPLSVAMRLQYRWGLPTVEDLVPSPLMRQLWDIVEASERHPEAPGWCPWCQADRLAGEAHRDDCLPYLLLGARKTGREDIIGTVDDPQPGRRGDRSGSARVRGLKSIREHVGWTQNEMAKYLGYHPNHYSRIERAELPLTRKKADFLCNTINVTRDQLFNGIHAT